MTRYLLLFLALAVWGATAFAFAALTAAVDGSAIREMESFVVGGFGGLSGVVLFTGAMLAPGDTPKAKRRGFEGHPL